MTEKKFKVAELKPEITIDVLNKVDIRCGTILKVEDIKESNSLVALTVDLGEKEPRTIICGMKNERKNPKEIEGKQGLFVANIKPRTIMGYKSHGMIFDIGYEDGLKPVLASPEKKIPNGSRAG